MRLLDVDHLIWPIGTSSRVEVARGSFCKLLWACFRRVSGLRELHANLRSQQKRSLTLELADRSQMPSKTHLIRWPERPNNKHNNESSKPNKTDHNNNNNHSHPASKPMKRAERSHMSSALRLKPRGIFKEKLITFERSVNLLTFLCITKLIQASLVGTNYMGRACERVNGASKIQSRSLANYPTWPIIVSSAAKTLVASPQR